MVTFDFNFRADMIVNDDVIVLLGYFQVGGHFVDGRSDIDRFFLE